MQGRIDKIRDAPYWCDSILLIVLIWTWSYYVNSYSLFYNQIEMRRDIGYDYLAKVLIIGDSGVGKTNILLRFC